MAPSLNGYAGGLLRVDLDSGRITKEELDGDTLRKYPGGTSLGARILYEEVPPGVEWDHPQNRLIMATGPLGATRIGGSGTFSAVTKGALTHGATSTQANGFWGAYLRLSGFDGLVLQGAAPSLTYLYIHDGEAELRDGRHLAGKDLWQTEDLIREELHKKEREVSIFGIGPAGENRVRFASICGDRGHVAAHNGVGAVMGSKNIKAVVVARGGAAVPLADAGKLSALSKQMLQLMIERPGFLDVHNWGTLKGISQGAPGGTLPVKNYTTSIYPIEPEQLEAFGAESIRAGYSPKPNPCWACRMHHCHMMTIPQGPYAGLVVEEPEYECLAAWGPAIGQTDVSAAMMLSHEVDILGMDTNEAGWVVALAMECYEKGILTLEDTDGLELNWGNAEAAREVLRQIATRQGLGQVLAEGAMRAAQAIGKGAPELAIHTGKGNTPRGHDHRSIWFELFDTAVSNTGTIETSAVMPLSQIGVKRPGPFAPDEISTAVALSKGSMQFEDSLGVCRFNTNTNMALLTEALNAATGWDFTIEEAMDVGRRSVNLMRLFNVRHGLGPDLDRPSARYGSTPVDGPSEGKDILPAWEGMLRNYYELMGWDERGTPLPETLRRLGLERAAADL
ncbi:MAG: aldehyde ferredoxin oxidoreductase C-terminal domain-containing protein [Dehalococcoidia bacterium]